jgi:hypothetical protein
MDYFEMREWNFWHEKMIEAEEKQAKKIKGKNG